MSCPYCGKRSIVIHSSVIYGEDKDYGLMRACENFPLCDTYCGKNSTLADYELRELRKECHRQFDQIWKYKTMTRHKAYDWLQKQMNKKKKDTHIALFNKEECKKLLNILKQKYMALPQNVQIPKSSQFSKLQDGVNKFRFLSDVVTGWEGWKDNKPFRHPGDVCKIKPEQVDLNQNQKPNINYFWAAVVWDYKEHRVSVLEITQRSIMTPLYELEMNPDWGDLKNYDVQINKKKEGGKTSYTVLGIPPKPISTEIENAYLEAKIDLNKLFDGKYPMGGDEEDDGLESLEDIAQEMGV